MNVDPGLTSDPRLAADPAMPDPDRYMFDMEPGRSVSLRQSFGRTSASIGGALGIGFKETTMTEGLLKLATDTELKYSQTHVDTMDLHGLGLDKTTTEVMGLKQQFGGGESATSLDVSRTITQQAKLGAPP